MKRVNISGVLLIGLLVPACSTQESTHQVSDALESKQSHFVKREGVSNQLLVILDLNANITSVKKSIQNLGGRVLNYTPKQSLFLVETASVLETEILNYQNIVGVKAVEENQRRGVK